MTYNAAMLAVFTLVLSASIANAQNAPPTYQADPDVYKVIFEDQNFRVITATWKAGATDKPHSHPVPSVNYTLMDCSLVLTEANGATRNINPKVGSVATVPITASHTAHNVGTSDCRSIFVERK
jgi:quercetin dioxygenase-like cupin family protein